MTKRTAKKWVEQSHLGFRPNLRIPQQVADDLSCWAYGGDTPSGKGKYAANWLRELADGIENG